MKILFGISISVFVFANVAAQQTAFFETTIYVEDAIGNIDSVVIGHDPDANYTYNPQFGEVHLQSPFDSVFEVRAAHWGSFFQSNTTLSKKIISGVENDFFEEDSCYLFPDIAALVIHASYPPVTISWDRNAFSESFCRRGSMITSHYMHWIVQDWWMEFDTAALAFTECMAESASYTTMLFDYGGWGLYKILEVEGVGLDTLYAVLITPAFPGNIHSPCLGNVGVRPDPIDRTSDVLIFPNPVSDAVQIDAGENSVMGLRLYDFRGRLISNGNGTTINMSGLTSGVYIALVLTSNGTQTIHKIVKQ